MRFIIKNIAKVKQANIQLDGLTIVAGGNGSGKSTISKSLFAIMHSNRDLLAKALNQKNRSINRVYSDFTINNNIRHKITSKKYKDFLMRLKWIVEKYLNDENRFIIEMEDLLDNMHIEKVNKESIEKMYVSLSEIANRDVEFYSRYAVQLIFTQIFSNQINTIGLEQNGEVVFEEDDRRFLVGFRNNIVENMLRTDYPVSQLNPIYITTSDLNESVANNQQRYYLNFADGISFANKELNDSLYKEIDLNTLTAEMFEKMMWQQKEFGSIVDEVVNGKLIKEDQHLVFYDNWCQGNIEFSNIASGLKIFIILQRLINNGSFLEAPVLIIDEPETNLHPEWQIKLANLLVLLNRKLGVRIYLNSHSPYFVRAMEYFAHRYDVSETCHFYFMEENEVDGMFESRDVTKQLGVIYDKLAEPFDMVM